MLQKDWLKIGGFTVSILGLAVSGLSDKISQKKIVDDLENSEVIKDLINKAVNEALKQK